MFVDDFKMESREDLTFPASDQTGCIAAWYEFLYVDNRLSTLKSRAHPPHIAIDQHSLDNPNQAWRGLQGLISMLSLRKRVHDLHTFTARATVSLENQRKIRMRDPSLEFTDITQHSSFRNANAFLASNLHERRAGIGDRETLGWTNRALNQITEFPISCAAPILPKIEILKVLAGEVVTRNDEIRLSGTNRVEKRLKRVKSLIEMGATNCLGLAQGIIGGQTASTLQPSLANAIAKRAVVNHLEVVAIRMVGVTGYGAFRELPDLERNEPAHLGWAPM